jgi:LacI family transcriptional regulator
MTLYLQGLGHRDIAFIQGPPDHFAAARRCEGFLDAMASAGLPVRPELVQPGQFSFRSGSEAGERLLLTICRVADWTDRDAIVAARRRTVC